MMRLLPRLSWQTGATYSDGDGEDAECVVAEILWGRLVFQLWLGMRAKPGVPLRLTRLTECTTCGSDVDTSFRSQCDECGSLVE
jgi:hypothetical protein